MQKLIKKKCFDLNLTHLSETLVENEGIHVKRETLRGWAHEIHHVKRAKRRRSQIRKRRERMESPGLLLQMHGSIHRWFGDKKSCWVALLGLFKTLYVDRPGVFGGPKLCNLSQVNYACEELGMEIIFANSVHCEGRISTYK